MDARSAPVTRALPHAVSAIRPVLGIALVALVPPHADSYLVLPIVLAACASDWVDGELARRASSASRGGRLVDNVCDFVFLACLFAFLARGEVWSPPVWGRFIRQWSGANWLPLFALIASFGVYFLRLLGEMRDGRESGRSPRGHTAGVSNYLLAVFGAAEMLPGVNFGPWLLEPAMVSVALINFLAVPENLRLMRDPQIPPVSPPA
jgi:phosphatidylglycerophosphate synthase